MRVRRGVLRRGGPFFVAGQAAAIGMEAQALRVNGRWKRGSIPDQPDNHGSVDSWINTLGRGGVILDWRPDTSGSGSTG